MNHHAGLFIWIDVVSVLNINSLMQAQNMQREQTAVDLFTKRNAE